MYREGVVAFSRVRNKSVSPENVVRAASYCMTKSLLYHTCASFSERCYCKASAYSKYPIRRRTGVGNGVDCGSLVWFPREEGASLDPILAFAPCALRPPYAVSSPWHSVSHCLSVLETEFVRCPSKCLCPCNKQGQVVRWNPFQYTVASVNGLGEFRRLQSWKNQMRTGKYGPEPQNRKILFVEAQ